MREIRGFQQRELRVEKTEDGKQYITGYAATFNTLSNDMGGWRERIRPGAFARAIVEKQDVRHTVNHALNNSLVLGRTKAGTTELSEDQTGLAFRTLINPEDSEAMAFAARVKRGDVNEGSFAFYVHGAAGQAWDGDVRELRDLDIDDIATVIYPAYPGTSATVANRALLPDGMPVELRGRILEARETEDKKLKPLSRPEARSAVEAATLRLLEQRAKNGVDLDEACESLCRICADICGSVLWYCYSASGDMAASAHLALLNDCGQCCGFCASALCRESTSFAEICTLCALIATRCAEACKAFSEDPVMAACADACLACAACCQQMAGQPEVEVEADEDGQRARRARVALALAD